MRVSPSSEQEAILNSRAQTLMIEARAGTGKTTTLAMLAAREPGVVLGLCFSEGARLRFYEKLALECPGRKVQVLTVEALARSQLTRIAEHGNWLDLPERWSSLEQMRPMLVAAANAVWQRHAGRYTEFDFDFERSNQRVEMMLQLLAQMKATLATLRFEDEVFDDFTFDELCSQFELDDREIVEIFHEFERRRQPQAGHILWQAPVDYATDLVSILRRFPEAVHDMPQADLLLVDEWHDVNAAEFELLQMFRRNARLVVVGDRHQVINAERGADPRFSGGGFELAFPDAERLPLSQSRRCGVSLKKLLERALPKCGFESHPDTYSEVRHVEYDPADALACARAVVARAKELAKGPDLAIILREVDQSVEIENALLDTGLPYHCDGFASYLQRPEIMALRALLHVASGDYSTLKADKESCELMVDGLQTYFAVSGERRDYDADHAIYGSGDAYKQQKDAVVRDPETLEFMFSGLLCVEQPYDTGATRRWKQRLANVLAEMKAQAATASAAQLLQLASDGLDLPAATRRTFVNRAHADSVLRTLRAFMDFAQRQGDARAPAFLDELRRRQVATRGKSGARGAVKALALATVQSAKGREWQQVLLPYMEEGQFPRVTRNAEEFAEERRYLYVAISRAIAGLTLFEPDAAHAAQRSRLLN